MALSFIAVWELPGAVGAAEIAYAGPQDAKPFFGNKNVLAMCKDHYWDKNILNYSNKNDIVPGILDIDHTANLLTHGPITDAGIYSIIHNHAHITCIECTNESKFIFCFQFLPL